MPGRTLRGLCVAAAPTESDTYEIVTLARQKVQAQAASSVPWRGPARTWTSAGKCLTRAYARTYRDRAWLTAPLVACHQRRG